jgi:glucose-1-phosphate cytidylyltransferase
VLRNEVFGYIHPGEELVRQPFQRLIEKGAVLAHKCVDFGSAWIPSRPNSVWKN